MSWKDTLEVRARQAGADWILANERQLKQSEELVTNGTITWKEGDGSEQTGRVQKLGAMLAIGQGLASGRRAHSSNNKFKEWIDTLKFESPFTDFRERSAAMRISNFFADGINPDTGKTVIGKLPDVETIFSCPHTRPNDVLKWMRKTGLIPVKPRNIDAIVKAREHIRVAVENGKTINRDEVSQETGAANGTVALAVAVEKARLEGITEGEAIALNAHGKFTKVQARHVEALIKKYRRELNSQFAAAVEDQVNKQVADRKAVLEKAQEACRSQRAAAFKDQQHWRALINNHKPLLTMDEFRSIVMALHPDNSASEETRARAMQNFNDKKLQLTGKA